MTRQDKTPSLLLGLTVALAAFFLLSIAVPPWEMTISIPHAPLATRPAGHSFVWRPPDIPNKKDARIGMRVSAIPYIAQSSIPLLVLATIWTPRLLRKKFKNS